MGGPNIKRTTDNHMPKRTRIIIGGLITALALAAAVGTANARRLAMSENHFLSHFRTLTFAAGEFNIICAVSIEGSFHEKTLEKVANSLVGYISEARVKRPCTQGEAWIQDTQERGAGEPESLPWHITYERFIGALPNITGIELLLPTALFLVEVGIKCVYRATTTSPMKGIITREAGGRVTGLRANEAKPIPKTEPSNFLCPPSGNLIGTGIVGTQVGYREITVTLVA
jgi:hypothetical protein